MVVNTGVKFLLKSVLGVDPLKIFSYTIRMRTERITTHQISFACAKAAISIVIVKEIPLGDLHIVEGIV